LEKPGFVLKYTGWAKSICSTLKAYKGPSIYDVHTEGEGLG